MTAPHEQQSSEESRAPQNLYRLGFGLALVACVVAGVAFGANGKEGPPGGIGYWLVVFGFLAGLLFGWRAVVLPFVGIGAYGLASLIGYSPPPTGDNERGLVWLAFTILPAIASIPVVAGAVVHQLGIARRRRSRGEQFQR